MNKTQRERLTRRLWRAESALRDAMHEVDDISLASDLERASDAAYRAAYKLEGRDEEE